MKSSITKKAKLHRKRPASTDGNPLLPGLTNIGQPPLPSPTVPGDASHPCCWVRSSAGQILDKNGEVIGFRHQLVLYGKVVDSGTGADARRRFEAQAEFTTQRLQAASRQNGFTQASAHKVHKDNVRHDNSLDQNPNGGMTASKSTPHESTNHNDRNNTSL